MIEVHKDAVRPETSLKLLATDHFTLTPQQDIERVERFLLQLNSESVLAELTRALIELEVAKTNYPWLADGHIRKILPWGRSRFCHKPVYLQS